MLINSEHLYVDFLWSWKRIIAYPIHILEIMKLISKRKLCAILSQSNLAYIFLNLILLSFAFICLKLSRKLTAKHVKTCMLLHCVKILYRLVNNRQVFIKSVVPASLSSNPGMRRHRSSLETKSVPRIKEITIRRRQENKPTTMLKKNMKKLITWNTRLEYWKVHSSVSWISKFRGPDNRQRILKKLM